MQDRDLVQRGAAVRAAHRDLAGDRAVVLDLGAALARSGDVGAAMEHLRVAAQSKEQNIRDLALQGLERLSAGQK